MDSFVTLHIHVVNTSAAPITIKGWALDLAFEGKTVRGTKDPLFGRFEMERTLLQPMSMRTAMGMKKEEMADLEILVRNRALEQNIGLDGWLRFSFKDTELTKAMVTLMNEHFILTFTDSTDHQHVIEHTGGSWPKNGTVVLRG